MNELLNFGIFLLLLCLIGYFFSPITLTLHALFYLLKSKTKSIKFRKGLIRYIAFNITYTTFFILTLGEIYDHKLEEFARVLFWLYPISAFIWYSTFQFKWSHKHLNIKVFDWKTDYTYSY